MKAVLILCCMVATATARADEFAPNSPDCPRQAPSAPSTPLWGIADTHAHQFANLAIGGLVFWGAPYSDKGDLKSGMRYALQRCDPGHGHNGRGDIVGNLLRGGLSGLIVGHHPRGFPGFDGWPTWDTRTHQQMYVSWLWRAYEGGLRLMVMHAVNAEGLCEVPVIHHNLSCDDSSTVERQIAAARGLERYIDSLSGGPGAGWYRIVRTSAEARDVVSRGKLAVVLGIEVDNAFDCRRVVACDSTYLLKQVDRYDRLGIRHYFLIHLSNNSMGGYSLYHDFFDLNNKKNTDKFPETEPCRPEDSLTFRMNTSPAAALLLVGKIPEYPDRPHCNRVGLTQNGVLVLNELLRRGMIVDVDHMSRKAITQAMDITASVGYPVISGHTGFSQLALGQANHEGQKTRAQVETIQKNGGMVSAIFVQGSTDEIAEWDDPAAGLRITNNCSNSSRTWAQAYLYAVTVEGGFDKAAVGFGSDQLLNEWFGPRFGPTACFGADTLRLKHSFYYSATFNGKQIKQIPSESAWRGAQADSVEYPVPLDSALRAHGVVVDAQSFDKDVAGSRVFDFNTDGMAHIGLLPDFIRDLRNIGLTGNALDPLFRSAGAYVALWERAEKRSMSLRKGDTP